MNKTFSTFTYIDAGCVAYLHSNTRFTYIQNEYTRTFNNARYVQLSFINK